MKNEKEEKWLNARIGNFTASNCHKLLVSGKSKDKIFGETAMSYILEVTAEMLTGESAPYATSRSIEWGNEHEAEAMAAYISKTGKQNVHYFGKENPVFFPLKDIPAGGSPDGLIENERVVEIKCPYNTSNHIENCMMDLETFKKERKEYYAQCQMLMIVTNTLYADFCSYDPRIINDDLKLFILEVPFDVDFCNNLLNRIKLAVSLRNDIFKRILLKKAV